MNKLVGIILGVAFIVLIGLLIVSSFVFLLTLVPVAFFGTLAYFAWKRFAMSWGFEPHAKTPEDPSRSQRTKAHPMFSRHGPHPDGFAAPNVEQFPQKTKAGA